MRKAKASAKEGRGEGVVDAFALAFAFGRRFAFLERPSTGGGTRSEPPFPGVSEQGCMLASKDGQGARILGWIRSRAGQHLDEVVYEPRLARILWGLIGGALLATPVSFLLGHGGARVGFVALAGVAGAVFATFVWDVALRRSAGLGAAWGVVLGAAAAFEDLELLPFLALWGALLGAALSKGLRTFEDQVERRLTRAEMITAPATPRARWRIALRRPSP